MKAYLEQLDLLCLLLTQRHFLRPQHLLTSKSHLDHSHLLRFKDIGGCADVRLNDEHTVRHVLARARHLDVKLLRHVVLDHQATANDHLITLLTLLLMQLIINMCIQATHAADQAVGREDSSLSSIVPLYGYHSSISAHLFLLIGDLLDTNDKRVDDVTMGAHTHSKLALAVYGDGFTPDTRRTLK